MLDLLILNYVESHLQVPHQIGFLTGLKTYQTYNLRIEFDPKLKKEYSSVREQLADYLKQISVESSYDFDQSGVTYLCDLNQEKLGKLKQWLDKSKNKLNIELKEVTELSPEDKKILLRKFSRRSHDRY
jgi:hypothetical protein